MTASIRSESDTSFEAPHNGHPVHRATALLEEVLHSPAQSPQCAGPFEAAAVPRAASIPQEIDAAKDLNVAQDTAFPAGPPAAFLELGQDLEDACAPCQPRVMERVDVSALDASALPDEEREDMRNYAAPPQLQGLVKAFQHSQRRANFIVAGSVGTALALTLCLLLVLGAASSNAPGPDPVKAPVQEDVSSLSPGSLLPGVHRATATGPALEAIAVSAGTVEEKRADVQPGRPLALGPLLPSDAARYLLLRGLPEDAALSAGSDTGAGTWMVKGEDLAGLTLTVGAKAAGDHRIEIFLLDAGQGPQARQRLVLHVDTSPQIYAAGLGLPWPAFFPDISKQPATVDDPASLPATPGPSAEISRQVASSDIDAARSRLIDLAGQGHADAAYRLALTYDHEVLAQAGLAIVDGDMETAQAWYERAAQAGHTEAAARLETIARRRSGA